MVGGKEIYIRPAKRRFTVSYKTWATLATYKIFLPPDATVAIGKKIVRFKDIYPWPTTEQVTIKAKDQETLVDVPAVQIKREVNMG